MVTTFERTNETNRTSPNEMTADVPATAIEEEIGIPGELVWLPANSLGIAPEYQRPLREDRVRRIARNFDPFIFGQLDVSERADGSRVVLDGQHRWRGVLRKGWGGRLVPCLRRRGLTPQQEATIFWKSQTPENRVGLNAMDRFRARLFAGEERALRIQAIVEEVGYQVILYRSETNSGIQAIGVLESVAASGHMRGSITEDGYEVLKRVLEIARDTWGLNRPGPSGMLLDGIARFDRRYRKHTYDLDRLVRVLQDATPPQIVAEGKEQARVLRMQHGSGVARAISQRYNHRLISKRLPDWESA